MSTHVVDIETEERPYREFTPTRQEHRWKCSCGAAGKWKPRAFTARQGGTLHQRKMERGTSRG